MNPDGILSKLFGDRKLKKNETELDAALEVIIGLERQYDHALEAKHQAAMRLQKAMEAEILGGKASGGHDGLTAEIAASKARADAAAHLIVEARKEAAQLIAAGKAGRKTKIKELQTRVDELKQGRTRRLYQAAVEFAGRWGLEILWPKQFMAGSIGLPAYASLPPDELEAIKSAPSKAPEADPLQNEIDALNRELADLSSTTDQHPDAALDHLLVGARERLT